MQNFGIKPKAILLGIVVLLARLPDISAEYYSSIDSMETLGKYEVELIAAYRQYLAALQQDLNTYRKFADHVRSQHQTAQEDVEDYLGNSINAYTVIKRSVADWGQLNDLVKESHLRNDLREMLEELNKETPLPDYNEVRGAVQGLARLQKMYNLNATDLARGEINGIYYESKLSPRDCFEIATNLFEDKDYSLAVSWFKEVLRILDEGQKQEGEADNNNLNKKTGDYNAAEAKPEEKLKSDEAESEDGKVEDVVEDIYEDSQDNKLDHKNVAPVDKGQEEEGDEADDEGDGNYEDYEEEEAEEVDDDTSKAQPKNKLKSDEAESEDGKMEDVVEHSHESSQDDQLPIKADSNHEQERDEVPEYDDENEPVKNEDILRAAPGQLVYEAEVGNEDDDYKYEKSDRVSDKLKIESLEYLALANYHLGRVEAMISYIDELLKIVPDHNYRYMINYVLSKNTPTTTYNSPVGSYSNYSRLCQGKQLPEKIHHKLKCKLETKGNPVFTLAPLKTEELSLDPAVMVYYNVLSDSVIERILEEAVGTMYRSKVNVVKGGAVSETRVSQQAWLNYTSPTMQQVYRIVSDVTGFDLSNTETMQVANYGIGGQYDPHHDYFREGHIDAKWIGNRIATNMIYLSEVEQGGYTVFPKINVYSPPVKGAMVMWHNLHKSLDRDARTLHAGCPVIKGTKRIGNIWTHSGYQEFRRPCALKRDNYKSFGYL